MSKPTDYIDESWSEILPYLSSKELIHLKEKILPRIKSYPNRSDIFKVFETPLNKVDVVIVGQDPYYTPNTATGKAFAVKAERNIPPSLEIIKEEVIRNGYNQFFYKDWKTLEHWSRQGVFLFNTALTVRAGTPNSHTKYWKSFSEKVIRVISNKRPCIWMLWGKKAIDLKSFIANPRLINKYNTERLVDLMPIIPDENYILTAAHPAAEKYKENAGFLGCDHFKIANWVLQKRFKTKINW